MSKKIGWVSAAIMAAACSSGGGDGNDPAPVGAPPTVPPTTQNTPPAASSTQVRGEVGSDLEVSISASDVDGDTLTFTLVSGPDWIRLSENGVLTGTPAEPGTFDVTFDIGDGTDTTRATLTVNIVMDVIAQAFATGDYTFISEAGGLEVDAILVDKIDGIFAQHKLDIAEIYQLGPDGEFLEDSLTPNWSFPTGSRRLYNAVFTTTFGHNMPFMATIWASHRNYLGVIGRHESGARYAAIGLNPVTDIYDAENDLHVVVANVLKWLNQGDLDDQTQIVLRDSSDSFADIALREWIDEISGDAASYNNFFACMNEDFDSCITDDTDIIVVYPGLGRDETGPEVRARLQQALEDGVGVFYIREEINGFQAEIHDLLHIENITAQQIPQTVNGENSVNHVYSYTPFNIVVIRSALSKIINDDWDYDLSVCSGPYECEENEEANQAIILLRNALSGIRGEIVAAGIDPFETHEVNPFRRGLLLVGDYYRDLISYPMPKDSTPSRDFIRAFFGELALVLNRDSNPVARDLGTYSRTDFADNLRGNQSLSVTSQIPFTTSGFYAIPGETVTITRTDTAEARVSIRVQSLDNEQSLPFREIDGVTYDRPVFVSSTEVSIEPGETIRLNSPYGGPIHIYSKENNRNLSFEFENVGTHPVWRSASDNDAFLLALASDNYDWVEMVTPSFEILSSKEKMEELLERPRYRNNPQRLADDLQLYMNDWPLWYEGFQGGMIQDNPLMDDHPITSSDYPAQEQAARQHLIMDRMTCTDGCIGNPYVIDWAVDPFAQQDQLLTFKEFYTYGTENRALADFARRRQLFFQGSTGVSASNLSYLHTHFRQFQASGDLLIECPTLPHETLYTLVQDAFQSPSAADFIEGDALTGLEEQTALFFQIMAALENQGVYESGWDLWPLFNHYERRWTRGGETWGGHAWDDGIALGYGNTSLRDVNQNIGYNSWMLLAISWITERDFTDYLQMWGFEFSEFGLEKVAGFGFEKIEPVFYAIPPTGHCTSLDYPELPVDGVSTWPN